MSRAVHPARAAVGLLALTALVACDGEFVHPLATPRTGTPATPPLPTVTSTDLRRLSAHELRETLEAVLGFVPAAIERMPPESRSHAFDRIVNDQTVAGAHLDAIEAIAAEASATLLSSRRLDDVAPACADDLLPPAVGSETVTVTGAALGIGPSWAVHVEMGDPTAVYTQYAPDPTAGAAHTFPAPGRYSIALEVDSRDITVDAVTVSVDGMVIATPGAFTGPYTVRGEVDITSAGPRPIDFAFSTEPDENNLNLSYRRLTVVGPIDPAASRTAERDACALALIDALATRAFRRPIEAAERARFLALYEEIRGAEDFGSALRAAIEAILESPHTTYLVELGTEVSGSPGLFRLSSWEMASRLSYALTEGPPDAMLRDAAARGELDTPARIETHARRILETPAGHRALGRFFEQWFRIQRVLTANRDPMIFPEFSATLAQAMHAETMRFIDGIVWTEGGTLADLFRADHTWLDPMTAPLYGVSGVTGIERRVLGPERSGILTQPSFLTVTAGFSGTSPVHRGVFVLRDVLCLELEDPPPDVDITPPAADPMLSTRERFALHSAAPTCARCHSRIDPIGFSFEDFDAIGRRRTMDGEHPVDAAGGIEELGLADGSLVGGGALARGIADRPEVASCFARQWYRFSMGRLETSSDEPLLTAVAEAARAMPLRDAVVTIVSSEAFFLRRQ